MFEKAKSKVQEGQGRDKNEGVEGGKEESTREVALDLAATPRNNACQMSVGADLVATFRTMKEVDRKISPGEP